jgi:hypothetical protein
MKAATPQSSDNSSNARIRSRGKEMIAAASPMLAIGTLPSAIHAAFSQAIVNLLSKFGQARLIIPLLAGKLESLSSRKIRSLLEFGSSNCLASLKFYAQHIQPDPHYPTVANFTVIRRH